MLSAKHIGSGRPARYGAPAISATNGYFSPKEDAAGDDYANLEGSEPILEYA